MRVGIYNPRVGTSESGGTETFLREMLKRLCVTDDVVLYTGSGELLEEVKNLDIHIRQIPFKRKESFSATTIGNNTPILPAEIESLSMYINARRRGVFSTMASEVDVVSTHYYLDNLLVSRTAPVPTLFRFPGIRQKSIRWKLMAKFSDPDLYLSNSKSTAKRAADWFGIEVDGTVYAGVDTDQFTPDAESAIEFEDPTILFVGRLDEGKGLGDLLSAHNQLNARGLETELLIVGEGILRDELEDTAHKMGTRELITFAGAIPHDRIHQYYAAADVFCLPSYHEGFPVVNMEAMATGLPVVSTNIAAVREQITDTEEGLLFEPGNVNTLTDHLETVLEDREFTSELGRAGRARAEELTWHTQADALKSYYEQAKDFRCYTDS